MSDVSSDGIVSCDALYDDGTDATDGERCIDVERVIDVNDDETAENKPYLSTDNILNKYSSVIRCQILKEENRLLRLDNELLINRENSLKERLSMLDDDYRLQNKKLFDAEVRVVSLKKELQLLQCKSNARHTTLETSFKELCDKVCKSERTTQRLRLDMSQLQVKNTVLEELVNAKNLAIVELESRLKSLATIDCINSSNSSSISNSAFDNEIRVLNIRLEASQQQLDEVVKELANCITVNQSLRTDKSPIKAKREDYLWILSDYNRKCIRLRELEVDLLQKDTQLGKIKELELHVQRLNHELETKLISFRDNERQLLAFYTDQIDDLKATISQGKVEISEKIDEYNKLQRCNEILKSELEALRSEASAKLEAGELLKSQNNELSLEIDLLNKQLRQCSDEVNALKMQNQSLVERERMYITTFNEYTKNTDVKLYKLELLLEGKGLQKKPDGVIVKVETGEAVEVKIEESDESGVDLGKPAKSKPRVNCILDEGNDSLVNGNDLTLLKQGCKRKLVSKQGSLNTSVNEITADRGIPKKETIDVGTITDFLPEYTIPKDDISIPTKRDDKTSTIPKHNEEDKNKPLQLANVEKEYNSLEEKSPSLQHSDVQEQLAVTSDSSSLNQEAVPNDAIDEPENEIRLLSECNEELENCRNENKSLKRELEDKLGAAERQKRVLEDKVERLSDINSTLDKQIISLKEQINTISKELEMASAERDMLKESFKETTTSFLKKETILIDSLKRSVAECHRLKTELGGNMCKCKEMVKCSNKLKSCWCRYKKLVSLRKTIAMKAMKIETSTIKTLTLEPPAVKPKTHK